MVRKLIIRIAKDEAGESNFSNFHLKRGAEIADELSRKYLIKEFNYKAEYDPVTQEEPYISIEIDGE